METLTADKFMEMKRHLDENLVRPAMDEMLAQQFGTLRVIESPHIPDTYDETETYKGHPIIQWIAKFIRFDPDVHVTRVRKRGRNAGFIFNGALIVRPETASILRGSTTA